VGVTQAPQEAYIFNCQVTYDSGPQQMVHLKVFGIGRYLL
ncbi:unnamed protein product, partial [Gulo gulo]